MTELIIFGATYLIAPVIICAAIALSFNKEHRRRLTWTLAIALPLGLALARLAGLLFQHNQPFAVEGFEPLVWHDVDNAFPSDHMLIGGVFASVAFLGNRRVGLVLWAFALLVGLARMLAGVHYGVDVLAAAVLALAAVWIARLVLNKVAPGVGTGQS